MERISFKENDISQKPALELLQKLGYKYLSPEEALAMRGGKTSNVLLEEVLRRQLRELNSIRIWNLLSGSGNSRALYPPRGVGCGGRWEGGSKGRGYTYTYG